MGWWGKKDELPDFWLRYEAGFKQKLPTAIEDVPFVVLDTETTGFNYEEDRMLCIGALRLKGGTMWVEDMFEVYIHQETHREETVAIHGIIKRKEQDGTSEREALKQFLDYLGNAVIVAHHAYFDLTMINGALKRNGLPKLRNTSLDTGTLYKKTLLRTHLLTHREHYTLDDLAEKFSISKKDRHTALGDAYITAIAFMKICDKLRVKHPKLTLKQLLR